MQSNTREIYFSKLVYLFRFFKIIYMSLLKSNSSYIALFLHISIKTSIMLDIHPLLNSSLFTHDILFKEPQLLNISL